MTNLLNDYYAQFQNGQGQTMKDPNINIMPGQGPQNYYNQLYRGAQRSYPAVNGMNLAQYMQMRGMQPQQPAAMGGSPLEQNPNALTGIFGIDRKRTGPGEGGFGTAAERMNNNGSPGYGVEGLKAAGKAALGIATGIGPLEFALGIARAFTNLGGSYSAPGRGFFADLSGRTNAFSSGTPTGYDVSALKGDVGYGSGGPNFSGGLAFGGGGESSHDFGGGDWGGGEAFGGGETGEGFGGGESDGFGEGGWL